jgi:hypothetical protein
MSEINVNQSIPSEHITSSNSEVEQSSSFILQSYLNDSEEEKPQYKLHSPLCVSQTYEEEFYDRVS